MRTSFQKINLGKKTFRIGMYTTVITCVVLAIVVFVNLTISTLPSDKVKFDTTSDKLFTISEQTEKIVKAADTDVTIYLLASETTYNSTIYELLERYVSLNSHIKVELKNPVLYPTFANDYTDENVSENSIIVVSDKASRYISYSSLYTSSYTSDYSSVEYSFNGESLLTSAINYVTCNDLPKVYMLTGHGEAAFSSYSSTITDYIYDENITTEDLSLLKTGGIPDDTDAIIILEPTTDMSSDELNMLTEYISTGGHVMLISGSITSEMTNFTALANFCGLNPVKGIVAEGDNYHCYMYNTYLLPDCGYHTITEPFTNYYIMTPIAQGIEEIAASDEDSENVSKSVSVTGLLETSDKSYSKTDGSRMTTTEKEDKDIDGPFYVSAISEITCTISSDSTVSDNDTETIDRTANQQYTGQFIYIGSAYILDDSINQVTSGANNDFVMNCIEYMLNREDTISIRQKSMSSDYLTINDGTAFRIELILIGIIPAVILIAGGIVCYRRKKEK